MGTNRKSLTLSEKLHWIEGIYKYPVETRTEIAKRLQLPSSTLNGIYAKKEEVQAAAGNCKIDVPQAMFYLRNAWNKVPAETILNCFRSAGFDTPYTDDNNP